MAPADLGTKLSCCLSETKHFTLKDCRIDRHGVESIATPETIPSSMSMSCRRSQSLSNQIVFALKMIEIPVVF